MEAPVDLYNLTRQEITQFMTETGAPKHTGAQVYQWLHQKKAGSFQDMTDLSKTLRDELSQKARLTPLSPAGKQTSTDGTIKYLWGLTPDQEGRTGQVESVLLPMSKDEEGEAGFYTACISTQAGCRMKCTFCATGVPKFGRHLTTAEIVAQILGMERDSGKKFSNIVVMGMGEPLDNYEPTQKAMRIFHDPEGLNLGRRRMTVSTSGLLDPLKKFIKDDWPVSLALSLHSADPEIRSRLMPINKSNPLEKLKKLLREFTFTRRLPVTLEYILLKGVNDRPEDAQKLAVFCKDLLCKVNLIRYNPVPTLPFQSPDEDGVMNFKNSLREKGLMVFLRERKGVDIDAACGQLGFKDSLAPGPTGPRT